MSKLSEIHPAQENAILKHIALLLSVATLIFFANSAVFATPYTLSTDGSEVTDHRHGLIWRRCAEGLSGRDCSVGTASLYSWDDALLQAKTVAAASGKPWRLPNIKELASIVDTGVSNPAIHVAAFPGTPPASWFWSATPDVGNPANAWYVNFGYGGVNYYGRKFSSLVRLVRSAR